MATEKQIQANRLNSLNSTGPKTDAGKAVSSLNRLRHGLYAETLILPGEDTAEFEILHRSLEDHYQPQDPIQQKMVDELAALQWKMVRLELAEGLLFEENEGKPLTEWLIHYNRVSQMQARTRSAWHRSRRELEKIQATAKPEPKPAPQPAPEPADNNEEEEFLEGEAWERQTGKEKNYKRAKRFELSWRPDPNGPEKVIARLYKGKLVDEFPPEP